MSEHEPIADQQATIEKAAKLREMVQTAGWREVFAPHIQGEIERYRQDILRGEFADLLELKASQQKLQYLEYILHYPDQEIATADEIIKAEAARQQKEESA